MKGKNIFQVKSQKNITKKKPELISTELELPLIYK